ncbi:pilus assembly protein TadG-related protein [Actinocorallia populi]|uniref:pilus assembly protein TadG-related protein n=1 Tax=Actinocorallia populi TaxID=2079200 RepID=UPI000D092678|nr:pilus assembly protein TadG-related protein [Actinocorallia populi]
MRGLMDRLRGDRGSMAPLVAVLLTGGILVGAAAVVVDVGRIYAEREELQSGADAAALAAVTACARQAGTQPCTPELLLAAARPVAERNASDGAVDLLPMCGRQRGAALLGDCLPAPANLSGCVGDRPAEGDYLEIQASTRQDDGSRLLPAVFSRAVAGEPDGTTVAACARVAWGAALRVPEAFKMMVSECAWNTLTDNGARVAAKPTQFPWNPPEEDEVTLSQQVPGCGDDNLGFFIGPQWVTCIDEMEAGRDYYGFDLGKLGGVITAGLLATGCQLLVAVDDLFAFLRGLVLGTTPEPRIVYVPVYDGSEPALLMFERYHTVGLAPFVITGVNLTLLGFGFRYPPLGQGPMPCTPSPCLTGHFVKDTVQGPFGGQGNYGLSGLKLAG